MSREFGSYESGYFHTQIETAAQDCLNGKDPLTKLYGEFLKEFSEIAYQISNSEAFDSGPEYPILATIERIGLLKSRLNDIEYFIEPYKRIAENAVRELASKEKK